MISRTDALVGSQSDDSKDKKSSPVLEFTSKLNADRRRGRDPFGDLMRSLSDSYENRRARQTGEWERMRRQSLRKAS